MPGRVIEHRAFMGPQLHNHSEGIIQYLEFRYLGYCLPIRPNRYFPNRFRLYCIYTHLGKREGGGTVQAPCTSYKLELHNGVGIVQIQVCARAPQRGEAEMQSTAQLQPKGPRVYI